MRPVSTGIARLKCHLCALSSLKEHAILLPHTGQPQTRTAQECAGPNRQTCGPMCTLVEALAPSFDIRSYGKDWDANAFVDALEVRLL